MTTETLNLDSDFDARAAANRQFQRIAALVICIGVLGTLRGALTGEKTFFLFKEQMHLSASEVGTLRLLVGLPAYVQPFMGAWSDIYPLFGYHRRSYFLLAIFVDVFGYLLLASLPQYHYVVVTALLILLGSGGVTLGVIINAVMVAIGNLTGNFGRLQSILQFIPLCMGIAFTSNLSGYVAQNWSYHNTYMGAALLTLLYVPLVALIDEKRSSGKRHAHETPEEHAERIAAKKEQQARTMATLRQALKSPSLWALTGYVFYLIITPGLNTAQLYFETDVLHFSKQLIGNLGRSYSFGAILGIVAFGIGSRRLPVRALVWGAWLMDCSAYPIQMGIHDPISAYIVMFFYGISGVVYSLCLYTLAARTCPPGIEGTIFALFLAAIALAGNFSEKFGSMLYDYFGPENTAHHYTIAHGWYSGLWVGFGFTVLAVVFIPFLPAWTRSNKPLRETSDAPA